MDEVKNGRVEEENKTSWYKDGKLHREDGPAVELCYGRKEWYSDGKKHREDGPAVESQAFQEWWVHGVKHRENGPAVIFCNGSKIWYQHGVVHREDGPAIEGKRSNVWYKDGVMHRDDGPAVLPLTNKPLNGEREWYLYGVELTEEAFNQWLDKKQLNEKLHASLEGKNTDKKNKI